MPLLNVISLIKHINFLKTKPLYLVLLLALLTTACVKSNNNNPQVPLPTGTFTGQFMRIHKNQTTVPDTIKANLDLSLSQTTGFAVTGDTTIHAGSHGSYAANAYYIQFVDQTYSATQPSPKYHLQGVYNYAYDGTQLDIYINYADTLSFQYTFKKTN